MHLLLCQTTSIFQRTRAKRVAFAPFALPMTPLVAVSSVMQSLKRFTAREGNRILGLTGRPFWQAESYDRLGRNDTEFARITRYIETNPVKAGLAATPEEFPWSSARPIDNRPQPARLPQCARHGQSLVG